MFVRFTNSEGRAVWVRRSTVRSFAEQEDGSIRLFLGYGLQTDVRENADEILAALADPESPQDR